MSEGKRDGEQELVQKFNAAISGAELDDLRVLAARLLAGPAASSPAQPSRRRSRRSTPVTLRVRVDLEDAQPPIWRRLDLRSDLTLNLVHEALQVAFGWADAHLHRFALGANAFDADAEKFLCPWEVEEGDVDGEPAAEVRLDETLGEPGDQLRYCYDYGDSWDLVLTVEQVLPAGEATPGSSLGAVCVDGRRAAPPENCGGVRTDEELAQLLPDPSHFDAEEVNRALHGPYAELATAGLVPELVDLLSRLRGTEVGDELAIRAWGLAQRHSTASPPDRAAALHPYVWFLERVGEEGLPLTAAGYLKPADVTAAAEIVPQGRQWIGAKNREIDTNPVLVFRERLQALGLVRKQKGRLLLTRAGKAARDDHDQLWGHLATRLPIGVDQDGSKAAGLLALLLVASTPGRGPIPYPTIAQALTELGWREGGGTRPVSLRTAKDAALPTVWALDSLRAETMRGVLEEVPLTAVAADLAARALRASP